MKLEIKNLTKCYGNVKALDELSVTFDNGIYGILGSNGAGKSTMANLIVDNIARETGEILCDGVDVLKLGKEFRRRVGYMPQQQGFYEDMSAQAFFNYMAELKEIPRKEARQQIKELLSIVSLDEVKNRKVGGFSGGMKQRVLLAQALLGNPDLLILDEPTAGLDPKERIRIRNYISQMAKSRIILLTTHVVSDIECIAKEVLLMKKGRLVNMGTPTALIESICGKVGEIDCENYEEVAKLQEVYGNGNVIQKKGQLALRLVGDELPEEAKLITENIGLEDVYMYYLEEGEAVGRLEKPMNKRS